MKCGRTALVKLKDSEATLFPYKCKCWHCATCARRLRGKLIGFAKKGRANRFITLTVRPSAFETPEEAAHALVSAWRRAREMLKRYHGHKAIEFLAVFEEHKSGWPHLHILCRSGFIAQKWLSKYMGERIDSPVVDIRKVRRAADAAAYVAKYIAKAPARISGTKRWWSSAHWAERPPKPARDPGARWLIIENPAAWLRSWFPEIATDYDPANEIVKVPAASPFGRWRTPPKAMP